MLYVYFLAGFDFEAQNLLNACLKLLKAYWRIHLSNRVVGRFTRVDMNVVDMTWGRFPQICIEIYLNTLVAGKLGLQEVWYNIKYEGLRLLCISCGCYDHLAHNCKTQKNSPNDIQGTQLKHVERNKYIMMDDEVEISKRNTHDG
ncbi:hypothetical protein RJT34_13130 [Clitoria ternatea]|uniref:DUF4283 domain-containing protein n=1 Tax=Clitoria ternatea TaxID=43366 RepID=A0AAN9JN20_CLITE